MDNLTDSVIIDDVLAGNTATYRILVNKYRNKVFTLVYHIILNREDAEEVAQDSFIKAFTALHSFKNQSSFATWLYRIAVNTALNKKKLKKLTIVDIAEHSNEETNNDCYALLQQCETSDKKKFIQVALHALRDEERICITLFYLSELTVNEIHELTGITAANIKVLLHRGRKHLYDKLACLLNKEMNNLR